MTNSHPLRLTKFHGLGNDFLVDLDDFDAADHDRDALAALARRLCDRRAGVGADGLLLGSIGPGGRPRMVLYNADGSRAMMSGNGIRCFSHAVAVHGRSFDDPDLTTQVVDTDSGARIVELAATAEPATISATVAMGEVSPLTAPSGWASIGADPGRPVAHLSLGNPHTVVPVEDVSVVDLAALGAKIPDVNLEIIEPGPESHAVTMRVHERGAGITAACGTGACAAAYAAAQWGLAHPVGGKLMVHMDGGSASVVLLPAPAGTAPTVLLEGPTTFIATLEIPEVPST